MKKIRYQNRYQDRTFLSNVDAFVVGAIKSQAYGEGLAESASDNAYECQKAFGRLCQLLANKNLLNMEDLRFIAGGYHDSQQELVEEP